MERKAFMFDMVLSELEDAVGAENVSTREADKIVYGVDYFWVSRTVSYTHLTLPTIVPV